MAKFHLNAEQFLKFVVTPEQLKDMNNTKTVPKTQRNEGETVIQRCNQTNKYEVDCRLHTFYDIDNRSLASLENDCDIGVEFH